MLRFIAFLLGREYEPCKACEVLKEELEIQRVLYQNLTNTMIASMNERSNIQQIPVQIPSEPIVRKNWNMKRKELEEASRERARELKENIERTEKEIGLSDVKEETV